MGAGAGLAACRTEQQHEPRAKGFLTYQNFRGANLSEVDETEESCIRTPRYTGPCALALEWLKAAELDVQQKRKTEEPSRGVLGMLPSCAESCESQHSDASDVSDSECSDRSDPSVRSAPTEGSVATDVHGLTDFSEHSDLSDSDLSEQLTGQEQHSRQEVPKGQEQYLSLSHI